MNHNFNVQLACKFGIDSAIILHNIGFWIGKNIANRKHFHDGYYWMYNTTKAFSELLPYMKEKKISRTILKLEKANILKSGNYNKIRYDHTKWYTIIDPTVIDIYELDFSKKPKEEYDFSSISDAEKYGVSNNVEKQDSPKMSNLLDKHVSSIGQTCPTLPDTNPYIKNTDKQTEQLTTIVSDPSADKSVCLSLLEKVKVTCEEQEYVQPTLPQTTQVVDSLSIVNKLDSLNQPIASETTKTDKQTAPHKTSVSAPSVDTADKSVCLSLLEKCKVQDGIESIIIKALEKGNSLEKIERNIEYTNQKNPDNYYSYLSFAIQHDYAQSVIDQEAAKAAKKKLDLEKANQLKDLENKKMSDLKQKQEAEAKQSELEKREDVKVENYLASLPASEVKTLKSDLLKLHPEYQIMITTGFFNNFFYDYVKTLKPEVLKNFKKILTFI